MALETCGECGGAVSTDARTCPHCGRLAPTTVAQRRLRQDRAGALLLFAGGSLAGVLVFMWLFATCYGG